MKAVKQEGNDSVKKLVCEIIENSRPDLSECRIAIIEASRMPHDKPVKVCASSHVGQAMGFDLTLVYSGPVFLAVDEDHSEMLVANALADWQGVQKEGRDGQGSYFTYKRKHAVSIHPEILAKYGRGLAHHSDVVNAVSQLELPLEQENKSPVRRSKKSAAETSLKAVALS
jgi:hypothetical protein